MRMYISLLMDRPIDKEKHYISPGGYEFNFNGKNISFDFCMSSGTICKNPRMIEFELRELDLTTFPESEKLLNKSCLKNVRKIEEFYIYTGEDNEQEINLERINYIHFDLDGEFFAVSDRVLEDFNLKLMGELIKAKNCAEEFRKEISAKTETSNLTDAADATNSIFIKEKIKDFGIEVDNTFSLIMNGIEIGEGCITRMDNPNEIYLEWIELFSEYQEKHLLRPALVAISDYFQSSLIVLEANEMNVDKYIHLGAEKVSYDDFREMHSLKLSVDSLRKDMPNRVLKNESDKESSKKLVRLSNEIGYCYLPNNDEPHEYQLLNKKGEAICDSSYFESKEKAIRAAQKEYPGVEFSVIDLTEKWYIQQAEKYRSRIKKLHPSFKKTSIILDMSELIYSRTPNDWYTFIPFEYNGSQWNYRENAKEEWVEKSLRNQSVEMDNKTTPINNMRFGR